MIFGETFWLILLVLAFAVAGVVIDRRWHICARVTGTTDEAGESDQGFSQEQFGIWLAVGVAIGVSLGAAMDNVSAGIAIGVAIGIAIGSAQGAIR